MKDAKPFILYGDAELDAIKVALSRLCREWADEWFSSAPTVTVALCGTSECPLDERSVWRQAGEGDHVVALRMPERAAKEFATLLLDAPVTFSGAPSPLVADLIDACMSDLLHRLARRTGDTGDAYPQPVVQALDQSLMEFGRGGVLAKLESPMPPLWFALGGAVTASWTGSQEKKETPMTGRSLQLSSREEAIEESLQRVEAVLGHATLSVGELAQLSIGDVIRLDTHCNEPLLVHGPDHTPLLRGRLCALDDHKALLISNNSR